MKKAIVNEFYFHVKWNDEIEKFKTVYERGALTEAIAKYVLYKTEPTFAYDGFDSNTKVKLKETFEFLRPDLDSERERAIAEFMA